MPNISSLVATAGRSPAPEWTDEADDYELLAEGVWRVPTLWFALFRHKDLVSHELEDEDGVCWTYQTPVLSRRRVAARLKSARAPLAKLSGVDPACWKFLLDGLEALVREADARLKYVVCQWQEIADIDAERFRKESQWLMRFFAGERVRQAQQKFEALCGFPLKKLKDPRVSSDDYSDADWDRLDQLLGDAVSGDAPWHPAGEEPETLFGAVLDNDREAVAKALGAGAEIDDIDVLCAAADDDPKVLRALLEAGGNPSADDDTGSCLMKAFNSRRQVDRKVELLLEHGADVNGYDDPTYGLLACCLAHGMKFAPRIIEATDRETLSQFKAWSETDHFHQSVARAKAGWAKQFVALVDNALKT